MDYVYLGRITNTHGLKGEIKILSNFKFKKLVFRKGFNLYIGKDKSKETIESYRPHQEYDMVILKDLNYDEVLKYKGSLVFIKKEDLNLEKDQYLIEDLISLNCYYKDLYLGKITNIEDQGNNNLVIEVRGNKKIYIPYNKHFIKDININDKRIEFQNVEGLI